MEWTDKHKAIVQELINLSWQGGGIRSPQFAQEVEILRAEIINSAKVIPENDKKG